MRAWGAGVLLLGLGCAGGEPKPDVTWYGDVRPVFEASCLGCHAEGGIGPFVMDLDEAAWADGPPDWVPAAVQAVESGSMPPWPPSEECHPLADSRALSADDKQAVLDWRTNDYALGRVEDFVAPEQQQQGVALGTPDLVVSAAEAYAADPTTPDDYRCFVVDHDFETDAWVSAFDVVPDRFELVHHVILYRLAPEYADDVATWDAADDGPGYRCFGSPGTWDADTLAGWAPGQRPEVYPEGVARRIAAGSKLVLQIHYNTLNAATEVQPDKTAVQLWLLPEGERPTWQLFSYPLADTRISLEPGNPNIVEKSEFSFSALPFEVTALGVFPHMHQLGKRIRLDVLRADGSRECVIDVPEWDFNWQGSFFFPEDQPVVLQPEDALQLKCVFDNSAANQPVVNGEQQEPRAVGWGDGTLDEMCLMYAHVLVPPGFL